MRKVRFATSNPHKVAEANSVGKEYGILFAQVKCPYPEVRDEDVSVVAEEGAQYVFGMMKKPVIVEDTGLFVDALGGFPGPYSAYVFRKIGCAGILKLMEGVSERSAHFTSAVGWCDGKEVRIFVGSSEGAVVKKAKGSGGFGYDPIFVPAGQKKTFAEDPETKGEVSHRRLAFQGFCRWLAKGV
jgi:XTP/dITP diphosphohydrolase